MQCGREPGGSAVDRQGVCPAASATMFDGVNGGRNAGRFCWRLAGTFGVSRIQGTYARTIATCQECLFFKKMEAQTDISSA